MSHYVVIIAIDSLWDNMQSLKNEKKNSLWNLRIRGVAMFSFTITCNLALLDQNHYTSIQQPSNLSVECRLPRDNRAKVYLHYSLLMMRSENSSIFVLQFAYLAYLGLQSAFEVSQFMFQFQCVNQTIYPIFFKKCIGSGKISFQQETCQKSPVGFHCKRLR